MNAGSWVSSTLLGLTLLAPAFAEDVAAEARAVGTAATGLISSGLSTEPAQDMTAIRN